MPQDAIQTLRKQYIYRNNKSLQSTELLKNPHQSLHKIEAQPKNTKLTVLFNPIYNKKRTTPKYSLVWFPGDWIALRSLWKY